MRNKFAGVCYRCGENVAPGDGHFEKHFMGWRTQHAQCAIKYRGTKHHYTHTSSKEKLMSESSNSLIQFSGVRLSFPHIATPQKTVNEQTGKERISYSAALIVHPQDPNLALFMAAMNALALDKWKDNAANVLRMAAAERRLRCYAQGNEIINKRTFQPWGGYEGNVIITTGSDRMPQIFDSAGNALDPTNTMACQAEARKLYAGCYANVAIKPWLQDNTHGRGVRCDFVAVQFLKDGEPLGESRPDASGMFGAVVPPAGQPAPGAPPMPGAPFPGAVVPAGAPQWQQPQVPATPSWM